MDIPITYTGIRPGEKLHEELTGDGDRAEPTGHPAISRVRSSHRIAGQVLLQRIDELVRLAESQRNGVLTARLGEMVAEDGGNGLNHQAHQGHKEGT